MPREIGFVHPNRLDNSKNGFLNFCWLRDMEQIGVTQRPTSPSFIRNYRQMADQKLEEATTLLVAGDEEESARIETEALTLLAVAAELEEFVLGSTTTDQLVECVFVNEAEAGLLATAEAAGFTRQTQQPLVTA